MVGNGGPSEFQDSFPLHNEPCRYHAGGARRTVSVIGRMLCRAHHLDAVDHGLDHGQAVVRHRPEERGEAPGVPAVVQVGAALNAGLDLLEVARIRRDHELIPTARCT